VLRRPIESTALIRHVHAEPLGRPRQRKLLLDRAYQATEMGSHECPIEMCCGDEPLLSLQ
jgi:hypothetical protein